MGVSYLSSRDDAFEKLYLSVREKEHRIFTDDELASLPNLENHPLAREWRLRKKSTMRFMRYLAEKKRLLRILDVGCGNGWFSHQMSTIAGTDITALDINSRELEQAENVFAKPNLHFVYADLFENTELKREKFDLVVFNSCFQYFENVPAVLSMVSQMLADDGEIHIIDTPFYKRGQLDGAKARTKSYYENLGFPEMALHYFQHRWSDLPLHKIGYKPSLFVKLLGNDSPFCWIVIRPQPDEPK